MYQHKTTCPSTCPTPLTCDRVRAERVRLTAVLAGLSTIETEEN